MRLVQRLVRSIDGVEELEEDVEQLRQAVAERRRKELRSAKVQAGDAVEVFDQARPTQAVNFILHPEADAKLIDTTTSCQPRRPSFAKFPTASRDLHYGVILPAGTNRLPVREAAFLAACFRAQ